MTENHDTCVVIPMFNESSSIDAVVRDVLRVFPRVVCVDDGSTDNCSTIAGLAGARVVRHPINLGQGAAIQTGFEVALLDPTISYVITFDADGQHRTEDAQAMLARARVGEADAVLGSRFLGSPPTSMPALRRFVLKGAIGFTRLTSGLKLTDTHNGLRVLNRRAFSEIHLRLSGMAHASEILQQIAAADLRYVEHPVTIVYSEYSLAKGQSNLNAVNIAFDVLAQRLRGGH